MLHLDRVALIAAALAVGVQLAPAPATAGQHTETGAVGDVGKVIILRGATTRAHGESAPRVNRYYVAPKVQKPREHSHSDNAPKAGSHYYQPPSYRYKKRHGYQRGKRYYHSGGNPYYQRRLDRYPRYNYGSYPYPSQVRKSYRQRSSYGLYFRLRH